jgi:hypothetical protein
MIGVNAASAGIMCPSEKSLHAGFPDDYNADSDREMASTVTKWTGAEYSTLRARVFCYYNSPKKGTWSIYIFVGDISNELRQTSEWKEGTFGGGSYWVCNASRHECKFPVH